ncbi:UbiA family prenyltransferase [Stieleria varia]|uniref:Prenyltransferase n=1 Tax=Stieleria varia TaxID=2528005 RepID=A0A5C6B729_9BACT|nr:UbiA family prenyltransferase [Stieleria varia]TWU08115.1 prenyltransferase [Stieleria varia]
MSQRLLHWAQLVRLPNVFTVLADVSAAFLLVAGTHQPVTRFACVLLAGVSLYWAGMILNDLFDLERDRAQRPKRPLASGAISPQAARIAGWGLLILGVVLAAASGKIPYENASGDAAPDTWLPAAIGCALAIAIVLYDGPLKSTPFAPATMGVCRVLSFLLGASPMLLAVPGQPLIPKFILGVAFGFGVYIMGITTMARDEATGGNKINLRTGLMSIVMGVVLLAFAPGLARHPGAFKMFPGSLFPVLIGLIGFPVIIRAIRVQFDSDPLKIQNTIRAGVLSIIPFAAVYAMIGAGRFYGLAVFALVIPAILLAARLRVT